MGAFSDVVTITIEVDDNNDHPPEFSQPNYSFIISENSTGKLV